MRHPAVAGLALAALIATAGASADVAAAAGSGPAPPIRYAKVRQVCAAPRLGRASCLALALSPARAGATGAHAYAVGAGAASSGPAGGLTPADLASAYAYSTAGGSGQTVAIVDAYDDPNLEADLATFDSHYGLRECTASNECLRKVNQTGAAAPLPEADTLGWSVEISLDVETVHSVCPNCRIELVEATSEKLSDLATAVNEAVSLGANEVSNSYGGLETEFGAFEDAAYDHPEVVIAAAAGDAGWLNWDWEFERGVAAPALGLAPASLPSVVAVGGTALKLKSSGARKSETVWNDTGSPNHGEVKLFAGSGGGCSTIFTAPAWQQAAAGYAGAACGSRRLDNDVAAVGDPFTGFDIYDSYQFDPKFTTGWQTIGGTSLSSPLITALYALSGGGHGAAYPAQTLYAHLGEPSALFDVTSGGNGFCDGEEPVACGEPTINELLGEVDCIGTLACNAAPGFDGPSGVGAPNGLSAFGGPSGTKPTVVTLAASSREPTAAVLNATVNPNGGTVTACTFEYGPTTAYGQSVPCSSLPGAGTSPVAVSATLTGLSPKSVYRFRITATNAGGTSTGKGKKLKTPAL